jgi:hypothetical protein
LPLLSGWSSGWDGGDRICITICDIVVYCYIVASRAAHLDNGHTTCATKNDTPALSAPKSIAISQSESPEGAVFTDIYDFMGAGMARV